MAYPSQVLFFFFFFFNLLGILAKSSKCQVFMLVREKNL